MKKKLFTALLSLAAAIGIVIAAQPTLFVHMSSLEVNPNEPYSIMVAYTNTCRFFLTVVEGAQSETREIILSEEEKNKPYENFLEIVDVITQWNTVRGYQFLLYGEDELYERVTRGLSCCTPENVDL